MKSSTAISIFVLVVSIVAIGTAHAEDELCTSPGGFEGKCVNINNCKVLVDLINKGNLPEHDKIFLRSLQCGMDGQVPKVCCYTDNSEDLIVIA